MASFQFQNERGSIIVNFDNDNYDMKKSVGTVIALPSLSAEIEVIDCEYGIYDEENNLIGTEKTRDTDAVKISDSFVMRELYGHRIEISISENRENGKAVIKNLQFRVNPINQVEIPDKISSAFAPVYRSITGNYAESYLYLAEIAPTKMLIIAKENLDSTLQIFMDWKNACGIETELFSITEAGGTSNNIKSFIADRYNNEDTRPDYLLLVGDVDDSFELPAFYIENPNNGTLDVTDMPYTFVEGDDYFPEIISGRFSIDSEMELMTIINKIIFYEKTPYMDDPSWLESATLIAGNYSSEPPTPTTPVHTSEWLAEKLDQYGYANVDEFYYPGIYPGTQEIINSINNGVNLITYRGWGNANGWHFPEFKSSHIDQLNNGVMLPVVTSFVCNTGDYANIDVDPCFGEKFIRAGTPSSPKGAVIFVGPSDLHTSTKYNNSMFSGFYHGLLNEDNFTFGTALMRSKYELYDNFPNQREVGQDVEFYFNVYNILGDPSLVMRTRIPTTINATVENEISSGKNYLEISADNISGGIISAVKDGILISRKILESDNDIIYFDPQTAGEIEVTITKPNRIPFIQTVNVVNNSIDLGISNLSSSEVIAGSQVELSIELTNYGTDEASDITANLTSNDAMVTVDSANGDFGSIAGGASATADFVFTVDPACLDSDALSFILTMSNGDVNKFELINSSILFEITELEVPGDGVLDPGDNEEVQITVKNIGNINVEGLTAIATAMSDAILTSDTLLEFGNIDINGTATASLGISVAADCFDGRMVSIQLDFEDSEGQTCSAIYTTEIGNVQSSDPTGADAYGYYAYDNSDVNNEGNPFEQTPVYEWHTVDPNYGGDGEVLLMSDDETQVLDLPFTFQYYGRNENVISICTNGWIAFEETEVNDFTNWNIPAALGPYGMVAAYWDDIVGELLVPDDNIHADVRISYKYFADEGAFVMQWNEAKNSDNDTSVIQFEIVLYDPSVHTTETGDGIIQINYHTIDNPDMDGNFATVGIENHYQTVGLAYTYANYYAASASPLAPGLAIRFTTESPDGYVSANENDIPEFGMKLIGNYPNPFNPTTSINFSLSENEQNVSLSVYNAKGQLVKKLLDEELAAGNHHIIWNGDDTEGADVSSGVYFYKLSNDSGQTLSGKCLLLK
jgi:hypothetical protein